MVNSTLVYFSLVFSLLYSGLASAAIATPEQLLQTAWKDQSVEVYRQTLKVLDESQGLNPLSKAQLRYKKGESQKDEFKNGRFKREDQEYTLRISPKGPTEFMAYRQYERALESSENAEKMSALGAVLAQRYLLLARLASVKDRQENAKDLAEISKRANRAHSLTASRDRSEIKSLIKNKVDIQKVSIKIAELEREYQMISQELRDLALPEPENFDLKDIIEIKQIQEQIDREPANTTPHSVQKLDLEIERLKKGLAYEKAKDDRWLNYIELSMQDDRDARVYGFEIGFDLPFATSPDLSTLDKRTRVLKSEAEKRTEIILAQQTMKNVTNDIKNLIQLYLSITEGQLSPERLKKVGSIVSQQDPILAIEIQKNWFEANEQVRDIEFQIRSLYVQYLLETSMLVNNPEINYFSKTKKRIL